MWNTDILIGQRVRAENFGKAEYLDDPVIEVKAFGDLSRFIEFLLVSLSVVEGDRFYFVAEIK